MGKCPFPFHKDDSPSFIVYPETQTFYCFGCGAGKAEVTNGNDIIAFTMTMKGLEFEDAIKNLAERGGVPFDDSKDPNDAQYKANLEKSREYFVELYLNDDVLLYLYSRGLSDDDISNWRIGFSKDDPEFYSRIIFPIIDKRNRTKGFTSRKFPDTLAIQKCKHSVTSDIFKRANTLYGIDKAKTKIKETGFVYITEGPFDCISMHLMGFENTVATLGCEISDEQVDIIANSGAIPILAYDGDKVGLEANMKTCYKFISRGIAPLMVIFPDKLDPNDFMLRHSDYKEAAEYIKENTVNFCHYILHQHTKIYDSKVLQAKLEFYEKVNNFVDLIPEGALRDAMRDFINTRTEGGNAREM